MNVKKYLCFLIIFSIFAFLWSALSFADVSDIYPSPYDMETEAGFTGSCRGDCVEGNMEDNELKNITNYHQCLAKHNSKTCKKVSKEERITCHREGHSSKDYIKSGSQAIISCLENFGYSFVFLFQLVWNAIQVSASMITDAETKQATGNYFSSLKNYTAIEFYKAYKEAKGEKIEKLLQAAINIGGDALNRIWNGATNFYTDLTDTFSCYNGPIQSGLVCSMVLGFIIPGGTVINVLKLGARGAKVSLHATNKTHSLAKAAMENMKKKGIRSLPPTELKKIAADLQNTIRNRILKPTINIPQTARTELVQFLNKLNPKSLKSSLEKAMKEKNPESPQFPTFVAGIFMSNAGVVLSKESRRFIIREIADTLATSYAKAHIRNSDFKYILPDFEYVSP